MSVRLSPVITTTSRSMGSLSVHSLELGDGRADPVIVFDDFRVSGRPFGPHPHAGFSAVTYVLRESPGSLRNRDSLGGHAVVGPGGACWLEAGSGAEHEEIPADSGKPIHGLQIFVNLRSKHKASPPRSLSVHAEQVPIWRSDDGGAVVRAVIGSYAGLASPLAPLEPFTLLDVELRNEVSFPLMERHNVLIYVRRGAAVVQAGADERRVSAKQAVVAFGGSGRVRARATPDAEVVLLAGEELREPVVVHGPFVMSDRAQVTAAVERYRSGKMGHLEPYSDG